MADSEADCKAATVACTLIEKAERDGLCPSGQLDDPSALILDHKITQMDEPLSRC